MFVLSQAADLIYKPETVKTMQSIYGIEPELIAKQQQRFLHLVNLFNQQFPDHSEAAFFSTPGRTEIGGNHTDHQRGNVLCASVNLDILALAAPNNENIIRLKSEEFPKMDEISLAYLEPVPAEQEHSAALIRGIAAAFEQRGLKIGGLDIYTTSNVPKGSGLSSSAAFEVLVTTILDWVYNEGKINPVERAIISQFAENVYFGKPSGLMDQCGCSVGGIITIDFKDKSKPLVKPLGVDFSASGYGLVITHTGGSHADLTGDYASIPADMKEVAACFGCDVLSEIDSKTFWQKLSEFKNQVSERSLLRAIHFFEDSERVVKQVKSLEAGQISDFLQMVNDSGISSWTKLQNIWSVQAPQEQPMALALALSAKLLEGQGACRVHGGGFAGTIQAFVPHSMMQSYTDGMASVFGSDSVVELQIRNVGSCELNL